MQDNNIKKLEQENRELKLRIAELERAHTERHEDIVISDNQELTDIVPIEELQALQDKFSEANGVTSVILNNKGEAITKMSNNNDVCRQMLFSKQECFVERRLVKNESPTNHPCRLIEATAPIYIGKHHIADWKIGMCGFGGSIAPFVRAACKNYEEFASLFPKMQDKIEAYFENIRAMLEMMANEISNIGYNKMRIARDFVKEQQNEQKLVEIQSVFKGVFDNSNDGIMLCDAEGTITEWSKGFEKLNGISKKDAIGKKMWDVLRNVLIGDDVEESLKKFQEETLSILKNRSQLVINHTNKHLITGNLHSIQATFFPVSISKDKKMMIGAIGRDVTEEMAAQTKIQDSEHQLRIERDRLQALGDNLPDCCLYRLRVDVDTKQMTFEYLSNSWVYLSGLPIENGLGNITNMLMLIREDDIEPLMNEALAAVSAALPFKCEFRLRSEPVKWIQMRANPRITNNTLYYDGIIQDITERKIKDRQIKYEKDRLEMLANNIPNSFLYQFELDPSTLEMKIIYLSGSFKNIINSMPPLEDIVPAELEVEDFIGNIELIFRLIQDEYIPGLLKAVADCTETMSDFEFEVRRKGDGRWMLIRSRPHVVGTKILYEGIISDITDQRLKDQQLKLEKDRLEALGDNLPDCALYRIEYNCDTSQMETTYLSASFEKIAKAPIDSALGHLSNILALVRDEDIIGLNQAVTNCVTTMCDFEYEVRLKSDGRCIQMRARPHREGNLIIFEGIFSDITERRKADAALRTEKERLQALGDNFPNGCLFQFQIHGQYLQDKDWINHLELSYASAPWEKISNIPVETAMSQSLLIFSKIYPEDMADIMPKMYDCMSKMQDFNAELRYRFSDKETKWLQISAHPRIEELWLVIDGFILDITDRKIAEMQVVSEMKRIQALGDNFPGGCLFRFEVPLSDLTPEKWLQNFRLTYASAAWYSISNIPIDTAMQNSLLVFSRIVPEDLEAMMPVIFKCVNELSDFNMEIRYRYSEEETKWIQISSRPRIENGVVLNDGFILDITDRKRTETELSQYRDDLEKLVKERTEELEASTQELYAINEELQATNEEFAVTNEELHTKNEQLQQEMTIRKQIMQQLETSESIMRNFISQSIVGIAIIDNQGVIIEWNPAQERLTGIPREVAVGKYEWETMFMSRPPEEQTEEIRQQMKKQCEKDFFKDFSGVAHPAMEIDDRIFTLQGEERFVHVSLFSIALPTGYIYGRIFLDHTEKRITDNELEQYRNMLEEMVETKTQELIASQERLVSLSDNLSGGAIFQILNGKITYISANFSSMFLIGVDEVLDDNSLFYNKIEEADRKNISMLYDVDAKAMLCDAECRFTRGDSLNWIHIQASCRVQPNGDRVWDGFMIDTTTRKLAEQELEEIRKRQSILIKVLQILQNSENQSVAMNQALSEIGRYAGVCRTYIFEKTNDGKRCSNTYEWCNEGVSSEIDNLQDIPLEGATKEWFDIFERNEFICTSDVSTLSPGVRAIIEPQGIKSLLILPLVINSEVYGFIGFDDCKTNRSWQSSENDLLISLSQVIASSTRRYRAEKAMQLSQQTMHTVLDNINANIYVSDFETSTVLFANRKITEEFNINPEGRKCWELFQDDVVDNKCDNCPAGNLLDKNNMPTAPYQWERLNLRNNKWYECMDSAIEWVDGRMVHMNYATDITDRKMAEEAVKKSEEMYRQLTVASPDAIAVCAPDGFLRYVSPRACELFLLSPDTDITQYSLFHFIHQHDQQRAHDLFDTFVNNDINYLPQLLLVREDQTEFFGEISTATVKDDEGNTNSLIIIIRDITKRKMDEMELIRAKEKAEESDKLKSAFLANMSHEIRTPINGIIGFLGFLNDDNLPSQRRQEYITIVNNSCQSLVKLIDDIIDTAKIEAKQMSIRPVSLKLNNFMQELQVFFETYLIANGKDRIALILDDSGFIDDCVTYVDMTRLRQVLSNLINNAIKFTEKGFIRFGYRQIAPTMLEFVVEDSGIGLAEDQLEVIFERFRQADQQNSRKYGGTGLGLTISRSLVQLMGGDIHVESVKGEGSSFIFTITYIPVSAEDEHVFKDEPTGSALAGNSSDGNGETATVTEVSKIFARTTIVVVESGVMSNSYYKFLLAATGAELFFAQNIQQWKELITQQQHIDVVLANINILKNADENDINELRVLRAGLPLALTTNDKAADEQLAKEFHCDVLIERPVDGKRLYKALKPFAAKK